MFLFVIVEKEGFISYVRLVFMMDELMKVDQVDRAINKKLSNLN